MLQDYINAAADKLLLQIYDTPGMEIAVSEVEAMEDEAHIAMEALCKEELLVCGNYECTPITSSGGETVPYIHHTVYQLTAKGRVQAKRLMQEAAKEAAAQKRLNRQKIWRILKQVWLSIWASVKVLLPFLHCF